MCVDHPESVLVHKAVIVVGMGLDTTSRMVKEIMFLKPDHIVRIEPTKRRPLRKVA